jgi:hypothetical protein
MMPRFAPVRDTATLGFWVTDTFQMRWTFLAGELEETLQAQRKTILQLRGEAIGAASASDTPQPPETESTLASVAREAAVAPKHLAGHTMLWGAGRRKAHDKVYNESTGKINLNWIRYSMGDFSARDRAYFTPQMETANLFLQYARARHPPALLSVVQFAVPNDLVDSLTRTILRCTGDTANDWRQVVWHSRNGEKLPRELSHVAQSELLIGDIATKPTACYGEIESPDALSSAHALRVDIEGVKTNALQWAYQNDGEDRFEEACHGKAWLHKFYGFRAMLKVG